MATKWAEIEVKRWLQGQKVATQRGEEQRFRFLLRLTPEEALRTYLALQQRIAGYRGDPAEPSPLLWSMRHALNRYVQAKRKRT